MTKKQKLETFDKVAAERDMLQFAIHDLANNKFSKAIRIKASDIANSYNGYYTARLSMRSMPIVLLHEHLNNRVLASVWTEQQIEDEYRDRPTWFHARSALYRLGSVEAG